MTESTARGAPERGPSKERVQRSARRDHETLEDCERRYRALADQLSEIGLIQAGSLLQRFMRCANPRCSCRADQPRLHGPYWQWSAKVAGKTVTRRLSHDQAERYSEWIANDRQLRRLVAEMRAVAEQAITLILSAEDSSSTGQPPERPQRE